MATDVQFRGPSLSIARWAEKVRRRQRRLLTALKAIRLDVPEPEPDAPTVAPPRREGWGKGRFRGVYATPDGRFQAKIRVAKQLHCCGTFDDDETAARAVDAKARELLGDAAKLNFPEEC